jgi:Tol biopolymer transport system component/DNA-binding winged helix-turn-helix (wHTH) protein
MALSKDLSKQIAGREVCLYQFGDFYLDPVKRVLQRGVNPVPLTPKVFDTLLALVRQSGRVIGKDELLAEIWPDTFVEEGNLAQNIFILRKTLGQGEDAKAFIETIPKHGYRFIAEVKELRNEGSSVVVEEHIRTHIVTEEMEDIAFTDKDQYATRAKVVTDTGRWGESNLTRVPNNALKLISPSGTSALSRPLNYAREHFKTVGLVFLSCLLVIAAFFIKPHTKEQSVATKSVAPLSKMRITRLTNTGNADRAAVSRDGKYVAYVQKEGEQQSLWLRQITAINNIQIVPSASANYQGLTFSPDGNDIYYVTKEQDSRIGVLYEVPVLGGTPRKIISDIDSNITFSPDAKRLAFVRLDPNTFESRLMLANIDGTGEQMLATHHPPGLFVSDGPAWSPDGKVIIWPLRTGEPNRNNITLIAIHVADGRQESFTPHQWAYVGQTQWLADGGGLLIDGFDETVSNISIQIWQVSYPSGEARMVTNDLNRYSGISMTADNKSLVTVLSDRVTHFWVAPTGEADQAKQITSRIGDKRGEIMGIAWTPDHRIVYGSTADDEIGVWSMNADGSDQKQLTVDSHINFKPAVSADGSFIVFVSRRTGSAHLWRMSIDGTDPEQITNGINETYPDISPDGRWVAYTSIGEDQPTIWRIDINSENSGPVRLTEKASSNPSISPDGKLIACFYQDASVLDPKIPAIKIAVIPSTGGAPIRTFDVPSNVLLYPGLHWRPDGRALTYLNTQNEVSNIWSQPLDGSAPTKLTNFTSEQIFRFAWSPDGKQLIFERGFNVNDVVLISDSN